MFQPVRMSYAFRFSYALSGNSPSWRRLAQESPPSGNRDWLWMSILKGMLMSRGWYVSLNFSVNTLTSSRKYLLEIISSM